MSNHSSKVKKVNIDYFGVIKRNTIFCASCGKHFNMKESRHRHFPFCEVCRKDIIQKEFGTIEKVIEK